MLASGTKLTAYGECEAARCVSNHVCVCVCESLMTDNSSFEFGSVFVSDYTSVCLFGCVCVCVRESDGKREVCSVIK